jgi:hypothetical protein
MPNQPTLKAMCRSRRVRYAALSVLTLLVSASSHVQSQDKTRRCPQFARVPGYGACTNIAGNNCGFCTYRCNDETVVRWNVCGG